MLRSTSYILKNAKLVENHSETKPYPTATIYRYYFDAPGLSAYEIHGLYIDPVGNIDGVMIQPNPEAHGDRVVVTLDGIAAMLAGGPHITYICEVKYYGVKDYRNFFCSIENPDQAIRAAFYLEEAERSFEAGAYFSFLLMAGAVLEALLQARLPSHRTGTLKPLIKQALKERALPDVEPYFRSQDEIFEAWNFIADARNMLHPNRLETSSIREKAMNCRAILDRTLKSVWTKPITPSL